MRSDFEILKVFADNLKKQDEEFGETSYVTTDPKDLAKDPEKYFQAGFQNLPKLDELTKSVIFNTAFNRPELFFKLNLHTLPTGEKYTLYALNRLLDRDPVALKLVLDKISPRQYFEHHFHDIDSLNKVSRSMTEKLLQDNPELFFKFKLDHYPFAESLSLSAAEELITQDALRALLTYKLHKDPKFNSLSKLFLKSLYEKYKSNELNLDSVSSELRDLAKIVALTYPEFYLSSKMPTSKLFGGFSDIAEKTLGIDKLE